MAQRKGTHVWTFALAALLAVAAIVVGAVLAARFGEWTLLSAGVVGVVALLGLWGVAAQSDSCRTDEILERYSAAFAERTEQFSVMLNVISEQQLLSDRGKAVAFREKDRDALNRAIREEMASQQWDAALLLVADMETAFGYKEEALKLRAEIAQQREAHERRVLTDARLRIDRECASEKWDDALAEAQRLEQLYPGRELTLNLAQEVAARKEAYKNRLLAGFNDAIARKDDEAAMAILQQLDTYLTSEEVHKIQESARGFLKARIESYREKYATCVREGRWRDAIRIGEDILAGFPTSKLAQEVRDMMETLRQRAAGETAAASA
jgi:membrane protein implicated in regulation of membrane protease activity